MGCPHSSTGKSNPVACTVTTPVATYPSGMNLRLVPCHLLRAAPRHFTTCGCKLCIPATMATVRSDFMSSCRGVAKFHFLPLESGNIVIVRAKIGPAKHTYLCADMRSLQLALQATLLFTSISSLCSCIFDVLHTLPSVNTFLNICMHRVGHVFLPQRETSAQTNVVSKPR